MLSTFIPYYNKKGYRILYVKVDLLIGYVMHVIGLCLEIVSGVHQYQYGQVMIWKKWFVLVLLKN